MFETENNQINEEPKEEPKEEPNNVTTKLVNTIKEKMESEKSEKLENYLVKENVDKIAQKMMNTLYKEVNQENKPEPLPKSILKNLPRNIYQHLDVLDGLYIPKNAISSHQRLGIHSKDFQDIRTNLIQTLATFHRYAEDNNILYGLHGGSLMGYYWRGRMIPWDDDIDIIVRTKDILKIKALWESGKPIQPTQYKRGFDNRDTRVIELYGKKYEILKNVKPKIVNNVRKVLLKLRPIDNSCFKNVPGGVDIIYCVETYGGQLIDSWTPSRIAPGPTNRDTKEKFPIVDFHGIKTRAILPKYGKPFLDKVYTKKWRIKCHPMLKFPNKNIT